MLLASVVETSRRVADTSKRLEKIELLATLLRQLSPEEIEIVVQFLAGQTRQGRIGIGYAALHDARNSPAQHPSLVTPNLEVLEVDRLLQSITEVSGSGSQRRRQELLQTMFGRSTEAEQRFLTGLLMGELRQGALEGIMLEAVARASGISSERVRRAAMMAATSRAWHGRRSKQARPDWRSTRCSYSGPSSLCSRSRPRTSPKPWPALEKPLWNTRWTGRACRSTNRAAT